MGNQQLQETNLIVQWYVPNRVLYVVVRGPLGQNDTDLANELLSRYLNAASEQTHILIDVTRVNKGSTDLFHVPQSIIRHPHIHWIVTVGATQNPIVNFGIGALSLKSKILHRDCPHMQAALDFLQHHDTSLPDLTAYEHGLIS